MTEMAKDKLCKLVKKGFHKESKKEYAKLMKTPKHLCKKCGRVADKPGNLCKPSKI